MNILFFAHESQLYGSNRSLLEIVKELMKADVQPVVVLPSDGNLQEELYKLNIRYEIIKYYWWVSANNIVLYKDPIAFLKKKYIALKKVYFNLKQIPKISSLIDKYHIDIIYSNSSVIFIGRLIAWIRKLPHVWHIREFKDLDHNLFPDFGNLVFKKILKSSNHLIFISQALKEYILPGLKTKFSIIQNPVGSIEDFERYKDKKSRDKDYFTFLIIGSIQKSKGQEDAIRALCEVKKELKSIRLLIVGKGDQQELQLLADKLKLSEDIKFLGHVDDPHSVYAKANAVLMCSKNEAFGRVTAEAMMHSLPVIGFNNAGTKEIIIHNKTGFLYSDINELVYFMIQLVKNNELCNKIGEQAWSYAKMNFNAEKHSSEIANIFNRLVSNKI